MNLYDLLPTKKVTAFVLGGALTVVAMWLLVDVFAVLAEWPGPLIVSSFVLLVGAVVAWTIPESAWRKLQGHIEGEVEITPTPAGTVEIEGDVTIEEN